MDLRITNTCDSDCMYCLEQSLRNKQKFIRQKEIYKLLQDQRSNFPWDNIVAFYGWNPLLHPDLWDIILNAKELWFTSISILSNTQGLNKEYLEHLIWMGLTGISFYFHSIHKNTHDLVVQKWISLEELYKNLSLIQKSSIFNTCIIHVHKQNVYSLYKIVAGLYSVYGIRNFEFIKVRMLSRAKKQFQEQLEIQEENEKKHIDNVLKVLNKMKAQYRFIHFSK